MTACIICERSDIEMREYRISDWMEITAPICRACFERGDEDKDFNDLPLVENEEWKPD